MHSKDRVHIITLEVPAPGRVVAIDERLPSHMEYIHSVLVRVLAPSPITPLQDACGEITLVMGSRSFFHGGCFVNQRADINTAYTIHQHTGYVLTGFYKDLGKVTHVEGHFLPYRIRIYLGYKMDAS